MNTLRIELISKPIFTCTRSKKKFLYFNGLNKYRSFSKFIKFLKKYTRNILKFCVKKSLGPIVIFLSAGLMSEHEFCPVICYN